MRSTIVLFIAVFAILGLLFGFAQSYDGTSSGGHRSKSSGGFMSASPSASSDAGEFLEEGVLYKDNHYGAAIYFTRVIDATLGVGDTTTFEYEDTRPGAYQNAELHALFFDEHGQPLEVSMFEDSTFKKSRGSVSLLGTGYISIPDNHASGALTVVNQGSGIMMLHVRIFSIYDKTMLGDNVDFDKLPPRVSDIAMDDISNSLY